MQESRKKSNPGNVNKVIKGPVRAIINAKALNRYPALSILIL
jgi:hypothetical protein